MIKEYLLLSQHFYVESDTKLLDKASNKDFKTLNKIISKELTKYVKKQENPSIYRG